MEDFRLGQQVEVNVFGLATVTCIASKFGCCGYVRYRSRIGVTYPDGTKYHCEKEQLRLVNRQSRHIAAASNGDDLFTITAVSMNGQERHIPNVSAMSPLLGLKRQIAKQVNQVVPGTSEQVITEQSGRDIDWSAGGEKYLGADMKQADHTTKRTTRTKCIAANLKLTVGENVLEGDEKTMAQLGITGPGVVISFFERASLDKCSQHLLMRDLLVAIHASRTSEAQALVADIFAAYGKSHLAHALKAAYLAGQMEYAQFFFEHCPAEVVFQALSMTTRPGYRPCEGCECYRLVKRETIFQHMAMTQQDSFLKTIHRRLEGRWISKLLEVEASFRDKLRGSVDELLQQGWNAETLVEGWAEKSTNAEYLVSTLDVAPKRRRSRRTRLTRSR